MTTIQFLNNQFLDLTGFPIEFWSLIRRISFIKLSFDGLTFNKISVFIPVIFLTFGICFLILFDVFYNKSRYINKILHTCYLYISLLGITVILFFSHVVHYKRASLLFYDLIVLDFYGIYMAIIVLCGGIVIFFLSIEYIKQENLLRAEYFAMLSTALLGLVLLLISFDFFAIFLALEILGLSLYLLASFKLNSKLSAEAGIKYIILGAVSSCFVLYGISYIYGSLLDLNFFVLKAFCYNADITLFSQHNGVLFGFLCILIGFLFKISAVPFHMWTPDVYAGAPVPVTAFFSIIVKFGIFAVFLRLMYYVFLDIIYIWQNCFLVTGILSIVIGCFGALYQRQLKRLIAYSSINHVGYLLLGVSTGSYNSLISVLLYLFIYVLMNFVVFIIILSCVDSIKNYRVTYITDLTSLGQTNPFFAYTLSFALFSLAGIPPLAGFFSKYYLFLSLIEAHFYYTAVFGIVMSVLSTFYYIRIVKVMFFENTLTTYIFNSMDFIKKFFLFFFIIFLNYFSYNPGFFFYFSQKMAHSLMFPFSFNIIDFIRILLWWNA